MVDFVEGGVGEGATLGCFEEVAEGTDGEHDVVFPVEGFVLVLRLLRVLIL